MAKTIPMIITNSDILVKNRDTDDFKTFSLPGTPVVANIPFYHHYAAKISETQHYFKEFIKSMYGKKLIQKHFGNPGAGRYHRTGVYFY